MTKPTHISIEKVWDANECVTERGNRVYVSHGRWQWLLTVDGEMHSFHDRKCDATFKAQQLQTGKTS